MSDTAVSASAHDPRSKWKLRQFFEECYRPLFLSDRRPATIRGYRQLLAYWEARTADPPLGELTMETLLGFSNAMQQPRPNAAPRRGNCR